MRMRQQAVILIVGAMAHFMSASTVFGNYIYQYDNSLLYFGQAGGPQIQVSGHEPGKIDPTTLTFGSTTLVGASNSQITTQPMIAAVGASGSLSMTSNGAAFSSILGADVDVEFSLSIPPPQTDFYYFVQGMTAKISGTLAPGTYLIFDLGVYYDFRKVGGSYLPNYGVEFIDNTPGDFSKTFQFNGDYEGDWFYQNQFGGFNRVHLSFTARLFATAGAVGTSSITVDPLLRATGGTSPNPPSSVPEPDSSIMIGMGAMILLGAARLGRRGENRWPLKFRGA